MCDNGDNQPPGFPAPTVVGLLALCILLSCTGCSLVEFERSPYAPRGVDAIYSEQEDITFLVWRVGDEVDFDRIDFELHIDGEYRPIDLDETPFPSEPFECDRNYYCVQYQIDGRWSPGSNQAPLRAIDSLHGVFESTSARRDEVEETFSIDPIAVDNNQGARARLEDWFADENIPIRRSFQWGMTAASDGDPSDCPNRSPEHWTGLSTRVELPHDWISSTPCFVVRPNRRDADGAEVRDRLIESPMLYPEDIDTSIPDVEHPIQLAFLVDLEVANQPRCEQYVDSIRETIFSTLDELDDPEDTDETPRDVDYTDLGTYRPIDADGNEYSGCDQEASSRYPVDEILVAADEQAAAQSDPSVLVVVYLNNLDLPPAQSKVEDLEPLFEERDDDANPHHFHWAIGSVTIMSLFEWSETTPWAPAEDDNFLPSIETDVERNLPLRSTQFEGYDSVALHAPNAADDPEYIRICSFSPTPIGIELSPDPPVPYATSTWPWPDGGAPELIFDIEPQRFVSHTTFRETRIAGVYEVCDEYCDHPFWGPDDNLHDSWVEETGVCRWN